MEKEIITDKKIEIGICYINILSDFLDILKKDDNDRGYTYGSINYYDISEEEVKDDEE